MSLDLIAAAKQRIAAAQQEAERLRMELDGAERMAAEWQDWVARAESLATTGPVAALEPDPDMDAPATNGDQVSSDEVRVQKWSLAGLSAKLVLEKGPLSLNDLVRELKEAGEGEGVRNFPTALNSALWRRKEDLFDKKKDKRYHLRTTKVVFIE